MSGLLRIRFTDTQQTHSAQISSLEILPFMLQQQLKNELLRDDLNKYQCKLMKGNQLIELSMSETLQSQGVTYETELIFELNLRHSINQSFNNEIVKTQQFGQNQPVQISLDQPQYFQQLNIPQLNNPLQQQQQQQQFQQLQQQQLQQQLQQQQQQYCQLQQQQQYQQLQQQQQYQQLQQQQTNNQGGLQSQNFPQQLGLTMQFPNNQHGNNLIFPNNQQNVINPLLIPPMQINNPIVNPQPQFQLPFMSTNDGELTKLKKLLQDKKKEYETLDEELIEQKNQVNSLKRDLQKQKQDSKYQLNEKTSEYENQMTQLNRQITLSKNKISQLENRIFELEQELQNKNQYISEIENEIFSLKQKIGKNQGNMTIQPISPFDKTFQNQIDELRKKNQNLQNQLNNAQNTIYDLQIKLQDAQENQQNNFFNQNNQKMREEQTMRNQIQQLTTAKNQLEQKVQELNHSLTVSGKIKDDRDKTIKQLKEQIEDELNAKNILQIELNQQKKISEYLEKEARKYAGNNQINNVSMIDNLARLRQEQQQQIELRRQQDLKQQEEKREQEMKKNEQNRKIIEDRNQIIKEEKKQKAIKLREAIMNNQGVLQVGLLIDVTGSMDQYKDATMNVIDRAMICIKDQTNRDCEWGTVCYQDFAELKLQGEYKQLQFTKDKNKMMNYLKNIKCDGGDDGAEDLNGGIKQMVRNLKWDKFFKLALLICDAPSHGSKWAGKVLDDYKNENLEEGLQELINKNIVLLGIVFNSSTDVMFEQMKNFYARQNKSNLLIIVPLKNLSPDQIKEQLIQIISEASVQVTEVKQSGTKTKQEQKQVARDGAFEALVKKLPDPSLFTEDPNIQTIKTTFDVYKVEINQESFEQNLTKIFKLKIPEDYIITKESSWDCIRTLKPFAFGQLKEVYLMKKTQQINSKEVYVIKMPIGGKTYKSMSDAILECRSHLISQQLMKKFMDQLTSKPSTYPTQHIRYSDLLILKEHDTSYWIAERFFQGQFLKFNNNFGYINGDNTSLNNYAQAFSYYTYHISEFNYMVCDIQGVGANFTDPAINTSEGGFDDTDLGLDGISQYIITFDGKANQYKQYLKQLDIEYAEK